jgi:hypothetical protein
MKVGVLLMKASESSYCQPDARQAAQTCYVCLKNISIIPLQTAKQTDIYLSRSRQKRPFYINNLILYKYNPRFKKGGPTMSRIIIAILFVLVYIAGCAISFPGQTSAQRGGLQSYSPPEVPQPAQLQHTYTGRIHNGCVEFRDPEGIVNKGPITRIEIAHGHGGFIYGIRLSYGRDTGLFHLGVPENELSRWNIRKDVWIVPAGETIVRVEGEIKGYYISRLKFFTDKGTPSPQFGSAPGQSFIINEPDSGGLRTISGYVNQVRQSSRNRAVTSMTFHFGAPCYIKDIQYDLDALKEAGLNAVPERLANQEIPNRTSVEQTVIYKDTKIISTTKTLTFNAAFGLKLETEVSVGLPGIAGARSNFEMSASTEFGRAYENKSTQEVSWTVPVRVPPGKKILAVSTIKRYQATVPFTYTIAWYWGSKNNIIKEVTLPGVYEGIHVEDLKHDFTEVALE